MLLKKLSLATLACLFATTAAGGCIITSADDDDASTDTTDPQTTGTPASSTSSDPSTGTTGDATTGDATTGTPGANGCGWGPIPNNDEVPNGYQCGFEGEDPEGTHPIACPDSSTLQAGLDCNEAGVTAEGCCDANGDVWYCVDPDGPDGPDEPQVGGEDCGEPTGTTGDATDTDTDTDATATDGDTDTDTEGDTDAGSSSSTGDATTGK